MRCREWRAIDPQDLAIPCQGIENRAAKPPGAALLGQCASRSLSDMGNIPIEEIGMSKVAKSGSCRNGNLATRSAN
ncbi:hypothetical protein FHT29_002593 [Rhizobium sp. SG741]|nr:hypothetical protein [Rhizobium sp. SG741]